jgi:MFS family permease
VQMAKNRGQTAVVNNFAGMWLGPFMGRLSDSVGRKRLMMMGRVAFACFFATLPHHRSMARWVPRRRRDGAPWPSFFDWQSLSGA